MFIMARKQFIVMWTQSGNTLASSQEDHDRIVVGRAVSHIIISRPGFNDVNADGCLGNFLRDGGGRLSFDGITAWLKSRGWSGLKRALPFSVVYDRSVETLFFKFIGDIM